MFEMATAFLMPYWHNSNGKYASVEKKKKEVSSLKVWQKVL